MAWSKFIAIACKAKKDMSVSNDPTNPNLFCFDSEVLLPYWLTICNKIKVICYPDLLFYDP